MTTALHTPGIPRVLIHRPSYETYGDIAAFAEQAPGVICLPEAIKLPDEDTREHLHHEIGQIPGDVTSALLSQYAHLPDVITKKLERTGRVTRGEANGLLKLFGFEAPLAPESLNTAVRRLGGHLEASRHVAPRSEEYKLPYQLGQYSLRSIVEYADDEAFPQHPEYGFGRVLAGLDQADRAVLGTATAYTLDVIYPRK